MNNISAKLKQHPKAMIAIIIISAMLISVIASVYLGQKVTARTLEKTGYLQDEEANIKVSLNDIAKNYFKKHNITDASQLTDAQRQELGELLIEGIIDLYGDLDEDEKTFLRDSIATTIATNTLKGKVAEEIIDNIEQRQINNGDRIDSATVNNIINEVTDKVYNSVKDEESMASITRDDVYAIVVQAMQGTISNGTYIESQIYESEKISTNAMISSIETNTMDTMKDIETLRGAYNTLVTTSSNYQKANDTELKQLYSKIETYQKSADASSDAQSEEMKAMQEQMMAEMEKMNSAFTSYQAEQKQIIDLINETLAKKADFGVQDETVKELAKTQKEAINDSINSIDGLISDIELIQMGISSTNENNETIGLIKTLKDAIASAQSTADSILSTPADNITVAQVNDFSNKITTVENAEREYAAEIEKLVAKEKAIQNYINIAESNVQALSSSLSANYNALTEQEVQDIQNKIATLNGKITELKSYSNDISDIRVGLTNLQTTNTNIRSNVTNNAELLDALDSIDRRVSSLSSDMQAKAELSNEGDAAITTSKNKLSSSNKAITNAGEAQTGLMGLDLPENPTMVDVIQKFYGLIREEDAKIQYNSGLISDLQEQMAYVRAWESRIDTLEEQVNMLSSSYATSADLEDLRQQVQGDITTNLNNMQNSFNAYQSSTSDKLSELQEVDKQLNRRIDAIKTILGLIKTNISELDKRDYYISGPITVSGDSFTINDEHIKADSDIMVDYELGSLPQTATGFTYEQGEGYLTIKGANGAVIKKIHVENEVVLTEWTDEVPDYVINDSSNTTNTENTENNTNPDTTTPDNSTNTDTTNTANPDTNNNSTSDTNNTNPDNTNTQPDNTNNG